jgi:thymidylate synthase
MRLFENADELFKNVLAEVLANGNEVSPRGMKTRELLHATVTLEDPLQNIVTNRVRKMSHTYSVAEFLWILLGRRDAASIGAWNPNIGRYSDDGVNFFGAYGPWFTAQLPYVVKTLKEDPDSRQAVMTIWQQSPAKTKDVPCTVAFQYMLRRGRLYAQTFMRSNDAWLGLPYDLFTFTRLQAYVASLVGAELGRYTHTVGSLHLYEQDWQKAREAVACKTRTALSPTIETATMTPRALDAAFQSLSTDAQGDAGWISGGWGEPWRTYLGLLGYKRTKDKALLRAPYDALIGGEA